MLYVVVVVIIFKIVFWNWNWNECNAEWEVLKYGLVFFCSVKIYFVEKMHDSYLTLCMGNTMYDCITIQGCENSIKYVDNISFNFIRQALVCWEGGSSLLK